MSEGNLGTTDSSTAGSGGWGESVHGLSVIIPVFNEAQAVGSVLGSTVEVADGLEGQAEVMVVDDGSNDGTVEVVQQHGSARLLRHRSNRGYGAALKTGIRHARSDLIMIMDADGTYPPAEIPALVEAYHAGEADMIVGSRVGPDAAIPALRRPAKWMINWLASRIAGERIPDVNSGMRIFRREVALQFFDLLPEGFSFTTTITLAMIGNGYLVAYHPIRYEERTGTSKIRPIADTMGFIRLILRIALYFAPLKIFLPLSGFFLLLAGIWAAFTGLVLGQVADASTAAIAMGAVQVAVVGLLAELINVRLPNRDSTERRSDS